MKKITMLVIAFIFSFSVASFPSENDNKINQDIEIVSPHGNDQSNIDLTTYQSMDFDFQSKLLSFYHPPGTYKYTIINPQKTATSLKIISTSAGGISFLQIYSFENIYINFIYQHIINANYFFTLDFSQYYQIE
jgi:hypothetical protein